MDTPGALTQLGGKLRELREDRKWSIEELAQRSQVSAGMISQIERGVSNPTYITLWKLAHGMDLPIAVFLNLDSATRTGRVVRSTERRRMTFPDIAISYELLTPDVNRKLEVISVEMEVGSSTAEQVYEHEGEECGVVLSGIMIVHVGDEVYELHPGDTISYPSMIPHWYEAPGPERAVGIWIITPPSF